MLISRAKNNKTVILGVKPYAVFLVVIWTFSIVASLAWNLIQVRLNNFESLRIEARTVYQRDVQYRRWNASHGGVYVPVTGDTPPNPYLKGLVPQRDITLSSGKTLTLINPAYMTSQMYRMNEKDVGITAHLMSLKPLNPKNKADAWEAEALRSFEKGKTEVTGIEKMGDQYYMRFISPLITEKGCITCHIKQGFKEGDIRGGISVAVQVDPLMKSAHRLMFRITIGHFLLWLMGMGGILAGASRLIKAEKERENAAQAMKEALEIKSRYTAMTSHELKTPLTVIKGGLDILLCAIGADLDGDLKEISDSVQKNIDRLTRLTADVLDLEKIDSGKMTFHIEKNDLNGTIVDVHKALHPLAEQKGVLLQLALNEKIPVLAFDKDKITQVLINLVSNAITYIDRGDITITTSLVGNAVRVTVTDTGPGIENERSEKLFEAFYREEGAVRKKTAGTGLGLAICKEIIEGHKGKIWAESTPGEGSRFHFTLPIHISI